LHTSTAAERVEPKLDEPHHWHFSTREQLFIAVVESSDDAIVTKTLDGVITGWNRAAEALFGFTASEAVGKKIDIIVPERLRGDVAVILDKIRRGEKVDHYETERVSKDGRTIEVSLSVSPLKSPQGEIVGAAKVARDITQQKKDQRALAAGAEELKRSNADLEQFAYVASHDLQEPLRMVATYTELIAERYRGKLDERADKYIGHAVDGAKRMQQLIKDLLAYSRVSSKGVVPVVVQADAVVENAIGSLKIAIEESGTEIVCDPLPAIRGDAAQLGQVFQNLIGNAIKFRAERRPHIRIGAEKSDGTYVFRVEDNGIGIDKNFGERIFQMFQRLHERGRYDGNGIGLAVAKKIVERHGGRIWFESKPDNGTTFFFTIPSP
jgi:PAS domain S-box-containing protein